MTLEQLGILSQLVGTLGVIASLIFVGVQIRQNTRATRAQVQENMTSGYIAVAEMLTANARVFVQGIAATTEAFAALSNEEKLIYFGQVFAFFKHFENMHSQRERGFIDAESWGAWSEHILMYFNQPGVQLWWSLRRGTFSPSFRTFLETSPSPKIKSMVDLLQRPDDGAGRASAN